MRSPDGKDYWSTGVYREIVPLQRIVATDSFADEKGNVVPATHYGMGPDLPLEFLVTVTFEEYQGKTGLTLTHKGFPSGRDSEMASQGWNESFDELAETEIIQGPGTAPPHPASSLHQAKSPTMSLEPRLEATRSGTKHASLRRDAARHQREWTENNQDGSSSRIVQWSWLSECPDLRPEWKHRLSDPNREPSRGLEKYWRNNPPLLWIRRTSHHQNIQGIGKRDHD